MWLVLALCMFIGLCLVLIAYLRIISVPPPPPPLSLPTPPLPATMAVDVVDVADDLLIERVTAEAREAASDTTTAGFHRLATTNCEDVVSSPSAFEWSADTGGTVNDCAQACLGTGCTAFEYEAIPATCRTWTGGLNQVAVRDALPTNVPRFLLRSIQCWASRAIVDAAPIVSDAAPEGAVV